MGDSYTKLPPVTISGLPRTSAASVTDLIEISVSGATMSASLGQVVQLATTAFTTMALDIFLPLTGGTLSGPLQGTTATFSNAPAYPNNSTSVATTSFVMSAVTAGGSGYLPLTGGTLSGDLLVGAPATASGVQLFSEGWISINGRVGWAGMDFTQRTAGVNQKVWNINAGIDGSFNIAAYDDAYSTALQTWFFSRAGSMTLPGPLIYNASANPVGLKKFQTYVAPDGNFLLQSLTDAGAPQFTWAFKRDARAGYTSIPGWLQIQPPLNAASSDPLLQESPIVSFFSPKGAVDHKQWHLWVSSTDVDVLRIDATADDYETVQAGWQFHRDGVTQFPGAINAKSGSFEGIVVTLGPDDTPLVWVRGQTSSLQFSSLSGSAGFKLQAVDAFIGLSPVPLSLQGSTVSAPTVAYPDNTTKIATTAFVTAAIAAGGGGSFLPLTGGTLTGPLTGTTATFSGNVSINRAGALPAPQPLVVHAGTNQNLEFRGGVTVPTAFALNAVNDLQNAVVPLEFNAASAKFDCDVSVPGLTAAVLNVTGAAAISGAVGLTGDLTISKDQPVLFLTDTNNAVDQKLARFWLFNDGNIYLSFFTDASTLQNQFQWTRNGEFISPFNVHVALNGSGTGYYIGGTARLVDELTNYTAMRAPGTAVNRITVGNDVNPTNYYTNDVHAIRDRALTNMLQINGTTAAFSVGVTGTNATFAGIVTGGTLANTADVNGYALSAGRYSVGFGKAALNTQGAYGWTIQVNGSGILDIDAGGVSVFGPFNATGGVLTNGVAVGYLAVPQNIQASTYAPVLADSGKHIYHASGAAVATWTIPANASVAYPIGTTLTMVNDSANNVTIAITTDTMVWSPGTTTGTRTLSQGGIATLLKVTATRWLISGTGLT